MTNEIKKIRRTDLRNIREIIPISLLGGVEHVLVVFSDGERLRMTMTLELRDFPDD